MPGAGTKPSHVHRGAPKQASYHHGDMTETFAARESTLLVPLASAEGTVAKIRRRLDPASRLGVPAHVTVLYPFAPPGLLDDAAMTRLTAIFARVSAFDFELSDVGWFEERVMYLAPSPASRFVELTNAIVAGFPDYPPYGGEFPEVTPHLTLAEGASARRMRRAAGRVQRHLPLRGTATEIWLMAPDETGHWGLQHSFPFRPIETQTPGA
jgi:2'-5' RNA ligase